MTMFAVPTKPLDEWLESQDVKLFPHDGRVDYRVRFRAIRDHLRKNVYNTIESANVLSQIQSNSLDWDRIVHLTNHGEEHISHVIGCATKILQESRCPLTPYEAYMLLAAILFHDVGNIFGRDKHEQRCAEIMRDLGALVGDDASEKRIIIRIASAHGGDNRGNKDTIGPLNKEYQILGHSVRKQFSAALLRFADELADDQRRSNRWLLDHGKLPPQSELHHAYSTALKSVEIHEREVNLRFELNEPTAIKTFAKAGHQTFLVDEIYQRTLKMHHERMYCMRFLRSAISIDAVRVSINIFSEDYMHELETINFELTEKGYPDVSDKNIYILCPNLNPFTGQKLKDKLLVRSKA